MQLRLFTERDVPSINKWLKAQGHKQVDYIDLPAYGYIVPGVAAGFVRSIEGGAAILDSLVSNPLVTAPTRHKAMDLLFNSLLATGHSAYMGFTVDPGTFKRAVSHGFEPQIHTILTFRKLN